MFYQTRDEIQNKYYKAWQTATIKGHVLKTMTGKKPTGNHYQDRYINMIDIYKQLHPYHFIDKEDVVIACGCNNEKIHIGTSQPLIFSTLAKKVITLEPDPVNTKDLQEYITKNNIKNIEIVPKAVWHTNAIVTFSVCKRTESNQIGKLSQGEHVKVPAITLDSLVEKYNKIDFVHLTINGTEEEALLGAKETLKTNTKISIAMIAKNHVFFNRRMKAIKLLEDNGYMIACADACPRAWQRNKFYFSVGIKNREMLEKLRFKEGEIPW